MKKIEEQNWNRQKCYKSLIADVAQLVEHILGKDEVTGSIPVVSSRA